jgi:hypothetical protein
MPPRSHHIESIRNQGTPDRPGLKRLLCPSSAPAVHDWEEEDMDGYLDFCERVLCANKGGHDGEASSEMHGLKPPIRNNNLETSRTGVKKVPEPTWIETSGEAPAGRDYMIFHAQDLAGEFPGDFKAVLDVAADWVGVGADMVAETVEALERRLAKVSKGLRTPAGR